jgi:ADP-ribose pyrophosphatase
VIEKVLNEQSVFSGRVIKLSVLDVELQDGSQSKRELVKHPGAVAVLPIDAEGNVLLVRQFRIAAGRVLTEVPAGTLNVGEDPLLCAERELQEEVGYRPGKLESLGGIFVAPGYTTEFIHLYLATDLQEARLEQDADEFIEVDRVPFAQVIDMIERGEIIDGKSIVCVLRAARKLGL